MKEIGGGICKSWVVLGLSCPSTKGCRDANPTTKFDGIWGGFEGNQGRYLGAPRFFEVFLVDFLLCSSFFSSSFLFFLRFFRSPCVPVTPRSSFVRFFLVFPVMHFLSCFPRGDPTKNEGNRRGICRSWVVRGLSCRQYTGML